MIEKGNKVRLFLDGSKKGDYGTARGEKITVPASTKLIAVRGGRDGILLKTSDGIYSGQPGRWLCSKIYTHGWYGLSFNTAEHTDWQPPELLLNKSVDARMIPAKWMKAKDAEEEDETYCIGDYGR